MSDELHNYITRLEERVRLLEGSQHSRTAPSWQDVSALDQKLKESHSEIATLKVQLAEQRISKSTIQQMIDTSVREYKRIYTNSLNHVFSSSEFREDVTSDAVELVRSEVKASLGSASGAATAAKSVARSAIDNSIQTLRSRSHYWARG